MLDIYADESCQNAHHFLVMGCLLVESEVAGKLAGKVGAIRARHGMYGEIKWTKVSKAKLPVYEEVVDLLFDEIEADRLKFHSLIVDATKVDHNRFNSGSSEIGYNKFLYQLLIHAGKRNQSMLPYYVYLDHRTTKFGLHELQSALNNGFSKEVHQGIRPFNRVVFRDSKQTELLQVNDLLCGAVGFQKNCHDKRPDASAPKVSLAKRIADRARLPDLTENTPFTRNSFRIWNLRLRE